MICERHILNKTVNSNLGLRRRLTRDCRSRLQFGFYNEMGQIWVVSFICIFDADLSASFLL
jgi:hypothetical protein